MAYLISNYINSKIEALAPDLNEANLKANYIHNQWWSIPWYQQICHQENKSMVYYKYIDIDYKNIKVLVNEINNEIIDIIDGSDKFLKIKIIQWHNYLIKKDFLYLKYYNELSCIEISCKEYICNKKLDKNSYIFNPSIFDPNY